MSERVCNICEKTKEKMNFISEEQIHECWDCSLNRSEIAWKEMVCPKMNRASTRRYMVMCQTKLCPSFEASHGYYYCKLIDYDIFLTI